MNKPKCLLIVEDSPEDSTLYRRFIEQNYGSSCQIIETELAEKGLKLFRTKHPDCILLDYKLPDMDGLEFLKALKEDKRHLPIPVIMLTGKGNRKIDFQAMEAGASDYLVKDRITAESLERSIRYAVQRQKLFAQQERELHFYEENARVQAQKIKEASIGFAPISENTPEQFSLLAEQYLEFLEQSREIKTYQKTDEMSEKMQNLVNQMGFLGIGPRDVIEIHRKALESKLKDASFEETQDILEAGRFLVIETMCFLLLYYQQRILGDTSKMEDTAEI